MLGGKAWHAWQAWHEDPWHGGPGTIIRAIHGDYPTCVCKALTLRDAKKRPPEAQVPKFHRYLCTRTRTIAAIISVGPTATTQHPKAQQWSLLRRYTLRQPGARRRPAWGLGLWGFGKGVLLSAPVCHPSDPIRFCDSAMGSTLPKLSRLVRPIARTKTTLGVNLSLKRSLSKQACPSDTPMMPTTTTRGPTEANPACNDLKQQLLFGGYTSLRPYSRIKSTGRRMACHCASPRRECASQIRVQ